MEKVKKDLLEDLKTQYNDGLVSALVGAGFSKNVSNKFPSWKELLHKMIQDLYEIDINRHYDSYCQIHKRFSKDFKEEETFREEYIDAIYSTEDPLEIISQYVKRKGYREALELYIEEKIPRVVRDGDNLLLQINEKTVGKISIEDFSAHVELLSAIRLQNIYTTNYDNLLEFTKELDENISEHAFPDVVKSGSELSNKLRSRNIIKIHGSLRETPTSPMEFDGDNKLCYICAREDYDTYKEKHEAFTSLMRIAMLQGKFMLLGFSGLDANYKEWVSWLSDILNKENGDTKIYIVDVSGKAISPAMKWYYNNHCTKVIKLFDEVILSRLGFEEKEISILLEKSKTSGLENADKRKVITAFLKYLKDGDEEKTKQTRQLFSNEDNSDKSSGKKTEGRERVEDSILYSNKSDEFKSTRIRAYEYLKLWDEVKIKVANDENVEDLKREIIDKKKGNLFPKVIYNREVVIDGILQKSKLNEAYAFLLALAIDESGLNPHYYSQLIKDYNTLNNIPLWILLEEKEKTFNGEIAKLQEASDEFVYENIQRNLFHFEFAKAEEIIDRWNPQGYFVIAKAIRLALQKNKREGAIRMLSDYINQETNPVQRFYAMQTANTLSLTYPWPYDTNNYYLHGIDSTSDRVNYMVQQLRDKQESPRGRGWIGTSYNIGGGNPDYEKSLRILRYISDTGMFLSYGRLNVIDKAEWYLVFKNLYKEFPYPCLFYSIQYQDKGLLTRIGQDIAYSPELDDFKQNILLEAVNACGNPNTPESLIPGLLRVTGHMYIAVDEDIWFKSFYSSIFKTCIDNFNKYNDSNPIIDNVELAFISIKDSNNILCVVKDILCHYKENTHLADRLIRDCINFKYINKNQSLSSIEDLLKKIIAQYPQTDCTGLIYYLEKENFLSSEVKKIFINKVIFENSECLPQDNSHSLYLCLLTIDNQEALLIAKQNLLKLDLWNCGVSDDLQSLSSPRYVLLNLLDNDKINWSDEEFATILGNLKENIDKYTRVHQNMNVDLFLHNSLVEYLSSIIMFIDKLRVDRKETLVTIRECVCSLLNELVLYTSFIEGMLSKQSAEANYALNSVIQGIKVYGLSKYLDEFNFILDKAIMGDSLLINSLLRSIQSVVHEKPDEILENKLLSKLHAILSIYKNNWTTYQEFKPVWSFNKLYLIASFLKNNGYENSEVVKYWLTDAFVQKFIRL